MYRSITLHYSRPLSRGTKHAGVLDKKSVLELFQGALALFYGVTLFMGAYVLQVDTYLVL